MSKFPVERGIPLPKRTGGRPQKYPWNEMQVGDSFFVPDGKIKMLSAATNFRTQISGHRYTLRSVEGGVRVWRVPDEDMP